MRHTADRQKQVRQSEHDSSETGGSADLRRSLRVIQWLNSIQDHAANSLGKRAPREAVLTLLILHKHRKPMTGKKLIQLYRAWSADPRSTSIEDELRVALGYLVRFGAVEVGTISNTELSKLKHNQLQEALGKVLEKGLLPLGGIRVTTAGLERAKRLRKALDENFESVRTGLGKAGKAMFDNLIDEKLPAPPAKMKSAEGGGGTDLRTKTVA